MTPNGSTIYVADTFNQRIEEFDGLNSASPGTFVQQWGSRQPNLAGSYSLDYPRGVSVDPSNNNLWVSDTRSGEIKEYTTSTGSASDRDLRYRIRRRGIPGDAGSAWYAGSSTNLLFGRYRRRAATGCMGSPIEQQPPVHP